MVLSYHIENMVNFHRHRFSSLSQLLMLVFIYLQLPCCHLLYLHSNRCVQRNHALHPTTYQLPCRTNGVIGHRGSTSLSAVLSSTEDLPNFFGINPIEGAVIFGVLYYIYGPDKLYEVVREAGRLFSTYGPVVKEIASDVYFEFRDYLEENSERDALRRQGVDVDSIPRRTTNIFERFQESMEVRHLSTRSLTAACSTVCAASHYAFVFCLLLLCVDAVGGVRELSRLVSAGLSVQQRG